MQGVVGFALVAFGAVLAFAGAELIARALRAVGRGPLMALGALAAALAASAPEFLFAVRGQWRGADDLVIGLIAGSLIANALIAAPIAAAGAREPPDRATKVLGVLTALGALGVLAAAYDGVVIAFEGAVLLSGGLIAAAVTAVGGKRDADAPTQPLWASAAGLLAGVVLLLVGAVLAVDSAVDNLSVAGLFVVGLGLFGLAAALPEIAAAAAAARRGRGRTALTNVVAGTAIVGMGALGGAALLRPVTVEPFFLGPPGIALAVCGLGLAALTLAGGRLPRWAPWLTGAVYLAGLVHLGLMAWR